MKKFLYLLVALFTIISCANNQPAKTTKDKTTVDTTKVVATKPELNINWRELDGKVVMEAFMTTKIVMIYVRLDGCKACEMLEKTTFKNKNVIKVLNKYFVPVQLELEKHPELKKKLDIDTVPSLVFMGPDGSFIGGITGIIPAENLLDILDNLVIALEEYKKTNNITSL